MKLDFGRHLAVALLLLVLSFIAASIVGGISMPFSFGNSRHLGLLPMIFAPVQMAISILHTAVSA